MNRPVTQAASPIGPQRLNPRYRAFAFALGTTVDELPRLIPVGQMRSIAFSRFIRGAWREYGASIGFVPRDSYDTIAWDHHHAIFDREFLPGYTLRLQPFFVAKRHALALLRGTV